MEPVTAIASTIIPLIVTEASKEGGKALAQGASGLFSQLITAIREKLRSVGREGILTDVEKEPTEDNQSELKTVLEKQMTKDEAFANQLRELVKQLESQGLIHPIPGSVNQTSSIGNIASGGNTTIGDINTNRNG